ncbi:GSU2403 family nucleotidyltransferase fold protein [Roseateles sp. So40a]|uniref:GSU2403 family nucleotidyltransferase fold protein n=1 Tax=Roseateles sp. So40a TaxID=3400226 RepID=UPI003A840E33
MLDVLRTGDPTFRRDESQKESAINAAGFSVDFLRRLEPCKHSDAFPISGHDGDVYPVQAGSAQLLLSSPRFDQVVVGTDGRMALMRTIDPLAFVQVKLALSVSDSREFIKRARDRRQAEAVQALLDSGRLRSQLLAKAA